MIAQKVSITIVFQCSAQTSIEGNFTTNIVVLVRRGKTMTLVFSKA